MRMEPEQSITRAMSRGRWTATAVAEGFGRKDEPKMALKEPFRLLAVTVAETAVVGCPEVPGKLALNNCVLSL